MKRVIAIEIILLGFFVLFLYLFIANICIYFDELKYEISEAYIEMTDGRHIAVSTYYLWFWLFYLVMLIADGAAMVMVAIKPFPWIKLQEKYKAFKEKRAEQRAIKAENNIKEKIAELEKQLSELKKDE